MVNDLASPSGLKDALLEFVAEHHGVFSLSAQDRGETDLVQLEIDTGSAQQATSSQDAFIVSA